MQVNTSTESSEQLVLPATEEEMRQYESHITATSQYSFSLSLPSLTFHIPGKHFLETLYNRFATDLALWQPATPASVERANATSMFYSSVDILQPAVPRNDKFRLCKSVLRGDPLLFHSICVLVIHVYLDLGKMFITLVWNHQQSFY